MAVGVFMRATRMTARGLGRAGRGSVRQGDRTGLCWLRVRPVCRINASLCVIGCTGRSSRVQGNRARVRSEAASTSAL